MESDLVNLEKVRIDPHNKNWTIPKTWGVWELEANEKSKKYRKGNYPIRGKELVRDYGSAKLIVLYKNENSAFEHTKMLNDTI